MLIGKAHDLLSETFTAVYRACDGGSFLRMPDQAALDTAFVRDAEHSADAAGAGQVRQS